MLLRYVVALSVVLVASSCKEQKALSGSAPWKGSKLTFSSGGGITGMTAAYTLFDNGQLFTSTGIVEMKEKELPRLSKSAVKDYFSRAEKIQWPQENVSSPGNMHYTLGYHTSAKDIEVTWGDGKYTPPVEIMQLYKDLNSLISSSK